MGRVMSDAEIRRRKKLQGTISHTTGTLGLAALGGTLLATKSGSKATKAAFSIAGKERPGVLKPKKLKKATAPLLATSAGIGGAGAFNFAAYTNAESRKKKMTVVKNDDYTQIAGEIGKAEDWKPVGTTYDPESKRRRRLNHYDTATGAGAGVAAAAGSGFAIKGVHHQGQAALHGPRTKLRAKHLKLATKSNKAGLALGAAGGALLGANALIESKKDKSWSSYSKSAKSGFGVVHD